MSSLIHLKGTGTSLIAGLLAGDENFGKVLGNYIGIGVEGFSGGGAVSYPSLFFNFIFHFNSKSRTTMELSLVISWVHYWRHYLR